MKKEVLIRRIAKPHIKKSVSEDMANRIFEVEKKNGIKNGWELVLEEKRENAKEAKKKA